MWPATKHRIRELIDEARAKGERKPIVVEAAILIEAKWQSVFDEVWLITAAKDFVIARVERERGLKPEQTEARIKAQLPDEERRKHASHRHREQRHHRAAAASSSRAFGRDALKRNG